MALSSRLARVAAPTLLVFTTDYTSRRQVLLLLLFNKSFVSLSHGRAELEQSAADCCLERDALMAEESSGSHKGEGGLFLRFDCRGKDDSEDTLLLAGKPN